MVQLEGSQQGTPFRLRVKSTNKTYSSIADSDIGVRKRPRRNSSPGLPSSPPQHAHHRREQFLGVFLKPRGQPSKTQRPPGLDTHQNLQPRRPASPPTQTTSRQAKFQDDTESDYCCNTNEAESDDNCYGDVDMALTSTVNLPATPRVTKKQKQTHKFLHHRLLSRSGQPTAVLSIDNIMEHHQCLESPDIGETPCALLPFLNLSYHRDLKVIICLEHQKILPLNSLQSHLAHHQFKFNATKTRILSEIISHLRSVLGNSVCESLYNLVLPRQLNEPLGIGDKGRSIKIYFQCPACDIWIKINGSYRGGDDTEFRRHLSVVHKILTPPNSPRAAWCQKVAIPKKKFHLFELPDYVSIFKQSLTPSFAVKTTEASLNSSWFHELKWPNILEQFLAAVPLETLKYLVAPPSHALTYRSLDSQKLYTSNKYVEKGLLMLRKELLKYLRDGQTFVSSLHGSYLNVFRPRY